MENLSKALFRAACAGHVFVYEKSKGRLGSMGGRTLILTTTGAKTGKTRKNPLMYLEDGERLLITASVGGAPRNPGWYHNLVANPSVAVQIGPEARRMRAVPAGENERAALYQRFVDADPRFGAYLERTERDIPVVILMPA